LAGRGGLGAVMGAKGIKAVVFDDREAQPVPIWACATSSESCPRATSAPAGLSGQPTSQGRPSPT
jgi:hypothetical protein